MCHLFAGQMPGEGVYFTQWFIVELSERLVDGNVSRDDARSGGVAAPIRLF